MQGMALQLADREGLVRKRICARVRSSLQLIRVNSCNNTHPNDTGLYNQSGVNFPVGKFLSYIP
jgi:hypothetical protein